MTPAERPDPFRWQSGPSSSRGGAGLARFRLPYANSPSWSPAGTCQGTPTRPWPLVAKPRARATSMRIGLMSMVDRYRAVILLGSLAEAIVAIEEGRRSRRGSDDRLALFR